MTLSLPIMNNLCKRWNLPVPVREACDLYFLRRLADPEFVSLLIQGEEPGQVFIREFGVAFEVVFLNDSLRVYTRNGELEKRSEPNDTYYWLSFRSITFDFQDVKCTKSYVLVQVDRPRIREELSRAGAVGAPRVGFLKNTPDKIQGNKIDFIVFDDCDETAQDSRMPILLWMRTFGIDHRAPQEVFEKIGLEKAIKEYPINQPTHFTGLTTNFKTFAERSQPSEKDLEDPKD